MITIKPMQLTKDHPLQKHIDSLIQIKQFSINERINQLEAELAQLRSDQYNLYRQSRHTHTFKSEKDKTCQPCGYIYPY